MKTDDLKMREVEPLEGVIGFIAAKTEAAEQNLARRVEMQITWMSGSDASWRKVGCSMSKSERLKQSEIHKRIAAKNKIELQKFRSALEYLKQLFD